jgi:hypothetical protein
MAKFSPISEADSRGIECSLAATPISGTDHSKSNSSVLSNKPGEECQLFMSLTDFDY